MAENIENDSRPSQSISAAEASILDLLFPGFTPMSKIIQTYLTVDLNFYAPFVCFLGLLVFVCHHLIKSLSGLLEKYCIVHLRYREDAYEMLMLWSSSQSFAKNARSTLVTTDLASSLSRSRDGTTHGENMSKKTLYYTPWNGRFFMWYKGCLLAFRRQYKAGDFSSREEVSISCFGRSPQILKDLLAECHSEYTKLIEGKTCLYEHQDSQWIRSTVSKIRRTATVILDEGRKEELLQDVNDFLHPASKKWYTDRDIPYRRGYLLYGPPGTGKSSLSSSIAGHFKLDIYILSLSTISEAQLKNLFDKLPGRCIILLEDVDAVRSSRDTESKDSRQIVSGSFTQRNKPVGGNVSLSSLLNVIDGVGSQEGRILIMTTNHIAHLDDALIRPGRVDKKVELGLADNKMTVELFCLVFKSPEDKPALPDTTPGQSTTDHEANRIEHLAKRFAAKVPQLKFSPAEIFSFLLEHRKSPEEAIDNVEVLLSEPTEANSKLQRTADVAKPEHSQWDNSSSTEVSAEMIQVSSVPAVLQPITPPASPDTSEFKSPTTLNDAQDLAKAVMDMQMRCADSAKDISQGKVADRDSRSSYLPFLSERSPPDARETYTNVRYKPFSLEERRAAWKYLLKQVDSYQGRPICSSAGFESLIQKNLNGREIRDALSNAYALAIQDEAKVDLPRLEAAIIAGNDSEYALISRSRALRKL